MKRNHLRLALIVVLALVFCISVGKVLLTQLDYKKGAEDYADAAQLAGVPEIIQPVPEPEISQSAPAPESQTQPEQLPEPEPVPEEPVYADPYAEALWNMDFAALREVNGDVLGWIMIPNTGLSYPLLQGEDNSYYLNHTWRGGYNSVGAIFLDYQDSWDLSDFHSIIYGHRVNNGSMFGYLHGYQKASYLQAHPSFYIADDNGSHKYEIFAVYEATSNNTYLQQFADEGEKQAFLNYCLKKSIYDTGVTPTVEDRVVTLSTCTGHGHDTRWVVQGVLR